MHGLGFISAWADYLDSGTPKSLTPQIALGDPSEPNQIQFEGFVEYAYDRQMKLTQYTNLYATNLTAQLVKEFGHLGQNFPNTGSLGQAIMNSSAYLVGEYM